MAASEAASGAKLSAESGTSYAVSKVIEHVDTQIDTRQLAESSQKTCAALGTSAEVPFGWARIHVKPHVGCTVYSCSIVVATATFATAFIGGVPWGTPIINIPGIVSVASYGFCAGWIWRFGPAGAAAPAYLANTALLVSASALCTVAALIGPIEYTPFGDRLIFIILASLSTFTTMLSGLNGGIAADHPPQPYPSIWPSMTKATFTTMRVVDVMTDIAFVRMLIDQGPDCTWYGKAVPCLLYRRLAAVMGVLSAGTLMLILLLLLTTGQDSLFSSAGRRFKTVVAMNTVIMLFEVGGITVVLLKAFSDMRLQGAGKRERERLRREAAFALTSCATTVCSFGVNVIGMRKLLAGVRAASHQLQRRLTGTWRASQVCPIDANMDGRTSGMA